MNHHISISIIQAWPFCKQNRSVMEHDAKSRKLPPKKKNLTKFLARNQTGINPPWLGAKFLQKQPRAREGLDKKVYDRRMQPYFTESHELVPTRELHASPGKNSKNGRNTRQISKMTGFATW